MKLDTSKTNVTMPITRREPAGIYHLSFSSFYFSNPKIEIKKKGNKDGEFSQRLNAGDLTYAYLVGLIEGDGWFSISKKGKYLLYEFGIELELKDVQLIYKIKHILGVGTIFYRNNSGRSNTVLLRVRNKSHLKNIILPIFDKYPFISNKQYDYLRFKNALLLDIKQHGDLRVEKQYIRPQTILDPEKIIKLNYFSPWLIGFIEAEGCSSVYKPSDRTTLVASFDISQTNEESLIVSIAKYLHITNKVSRDKNNNFKLKCTSVRSIENVINFIQRNSVQLLGKKRLQYLLWLNQLRTIKRYSDKITIPSKY